MPSFFMYAFYWLIASTITTFLNRTLPDRFISKYSSIIFRRRINPQFYEKRLKVKAWKDRMPEMSSYDKTVFDKSSLRSMNDAYLNKYLTELDKGLFAHSFPLVFLLPIANTISNDTVIIANAVLLSMMHMPFLVILRYNQGRMLKLLELKRKREERRVERRVECREEQQKSKEM